MGGVVQELQLPSGNVLFEWHSVDHVSPAESYAAITSPFDYFHLELDRADRGREPTRLRAQHLDDLQDRPWKRRSDLATRWEEQ